jgi:hypothetical protein
VCSSDLKIPSHIKKILLIIAVMATSYATLIHIIHDSKKQAGAKSTSAENH